MANNNFQHDFETVVTVDGEDFTAIVVAEFDYDEVEIISVEVGGIQCVNSLSERMIELLCEEALNLQ